MAPREISKRVTVTQSIVVDAAEILEKIDATRPPNLFDGPIGSRDASELYSAVLSETGGRTAAGSTALDLGCGPRDQVFAVEHLGYSYLGLDLRSEKADVLGDAHWLPLRDQSFDLVIAYAVLEHVASPSAFLLEIQRVLKRGGLFVGTASLGEPFHDSFFHVTPWGLVALFEPTDLSIVRLWPSRDTLEALASMGRYPRVIKLLLALLARLQRAAPILAPRAMFKSGKIRRMEQLYRAGSLCFLAARS